MNFNSDIKTIKYIGKISQVADVKRPYVLLLVVSVLMVITAIVGISNRSDRTKCNVTGTCGHMPRDSIQNPWTILYRKFYLIMKLNDTLASYLVGIGTIDEGERNVTLYKTGIHLRRNFGLCGDDLLQHLYDLNSAKCNPPLEDGEVETIAGSVDRSNTPVGSCTRSANEYLGKEVSLFSSAIANTPIEILSIGQFLGNCKDGTYRELIEEIRAEPDKERRNVLKKKLPCVTIQSEPCEQRSRESCKNNAVICLDFDHIDDIEKAKQAIASSPHVIAVFVSASGQGLFALVVLAEPAENLKQVLTAIQEIFEFTIDKACSDVSRLRFGTYDPDAILKDNVTPYSTKRKSSPFFVLPSKGSLDVANTVLKSIYDFNGIPTLVHYSGYYWQWTGNFYRRIEEGKVTQDLVDFLARAKIECPSKDGDGPSIYADISVTTSLVNSTREMLKSRIFKSADNVVPFWIGDEFCEKTVSTVDTSLLIFGKSKILNLKNMETLPYSPRCFNTAALDFDYDPNAECPQWVAFLDSIFGEDEESKQTLMEWMGLCLTSITKFHKAFFIIGPKRSGKGTIARILQKIIGSHNSIAPATSDFGSSFGLQSFIGKTLAIISDARFAKQRTTQVLERVLTITGEDMLTIDRKHKDAVSLHLQTKLMFISNEVPEIVDQSGAFASRFIFLKLSKSFYDNEDTELENKLSLELPGILRLAIQHLQKLLERGRFIQPETGKTILKRMTSLSSPVSDFIQQLTPYMTQDMIWEKWVDYCLAEGQGLCHGTKRALWNNLESAGYTCDFDTADILAKIEHDGGESTISDIRNCTSKYHKKGGTELLKRKLQEMIKADLLTARHETAKNGQMVEYFTIVNKLDDPSADDA